MTAHKPPHKRGRPTIGVLAGWQLYGQMYGRATLRSFPDALLRGIRAAAQDMECNALFACGVGPATMPTATRPAWPILSPETDFVPVGPWNTDGLIVVHPLLSEARTHYIRACIASGHPVVHIGTAEGGPAIGIDNKSGIHQAIAHLAAHGHRRIAFIAGNPSDTAGDSGERLQAYYESIRNLALEDAPGLVVYGLHIIEGGQQAMRQLLESGTSFTAVLASNDESAIGAMRVLRESDIHVPQDIALISFDNQYEASVQFPPLTSVHSPTFERGYRAVELLLGRIDGCRQETEILRVPTQLVVRQSCGCQPDELSTLALDVPLMQDASPAERVAILDRLTQAMAETVLTRVQRMKSDEVHTLCQRLTETFAASLTDNRPTKFLTVLREVLQRVEEAEENTQAWQSALMALRGIALLVGQDFALRQQAETTLRYAWSIVGESAHRQYIRQIVEQNWVADQSGLLNARLLAAASETDVFDILMEHLRDLGIRHAGIALFEPEGDDPVAWSVLQAALKPQVTPTRFPSRQFPPEELVHGNELFSLALLPLATEGIPLGFVALDTTNLELCGIAVWQLTAALRNVRLHREAAEGRRLAEEANRLKSRFLSTVSHELRTPLNLIISLSEILIQAEQTQQSGLPDPYRKDLERILASAHHLDGLIRDVLDLARNEMGQLKLACEPLDLVDVFQHIEAIGEQMVKGKGLTWQAEIPSTLPRVWGDRTRLRQVVLNLISNAVKFTEHGTVALRITTEGDAITVAVSDTGLGIPAEEQQLIFDEFRQSDRTTARGYGGLGLGLAICKRLVELHGGTIGVQSSGKEGAGSTFTFTLPTMKGGLPSQETTTRTLTQGQTVLMLTENPSCTDERLQGYLSRQGFAVKILPINENTDWMAQLIASPPAAIVLDSQLASAQGWETMNLLKGNPATCDIPIMLYSLSQEQGSGSVLELDYLAKPIGTEELARALERQGLDGTDAEKIILIVDDEPAILEMHTRVVQAQFPSYRVLKARDGREALDLIRQEQPNLVLLDLMMPGLDGFSVLEAMQKEETSRRIPVIVLTGRVLTEEDMERLNRGVAAVLNKGLFSAEETLEHIAGALARKRKLGSEAQRLVRKAMAYIHEHYAQPLSREEIAYRVGVSSDYLTRCFRHELGVTPMAYLNRYRVHKAKLLLTTTKKTITEIALATGFSDNNYFSQVFRRETGQSPSAYRRA